MKTTLGQLLINEALPEDMRDYERVLDKKGVAALLQEVAEKHPEKYRLVAKRLADVGRDAAYTTGGHSFGLRSLRRSLAGRKMEMALSAKLDQIYRSPMSDDEKDAAILEAASEYQGKLSDEVLEEATAANNPLSRQLRGAGRGNKYQLNSLLGADILYTDHHGGVVPIPVLRSYSQGLRPHEYFAGAFGARKGIIDLKTATQDAGFFAKQLVQAAHRLLVSGEDEDPYDELQPRGFVVDTDDVDNEGALLAQPVGGYPRNTELTPKILREIRDAGHERVLVRSPMVGGPRDGGVWARDVGRRERGGRPPVGDFVGIAAAQALAEPLTQAQISSKHTGGIAGAAGAGAISGFKYINQLVQVPKRFRSGAAHAQAGGTVEAITKAPQGGHHIQIGGEKHYVGAEYDLRVEKGDTVEAGDVLSEGIPNPAEIVRHKGIGEGRAYFVQAFRQALEDANIRGHRRNVELLSRGLINHVRLTDEVGDWVQDDVVPYQLLERTWRPRPGHVITAPKSALGQYLERPILHHSVGTQIRPSMLGDLERFGVKEVAVHANPPPFHPEMVRGMSTLQHDPDWMTRLLGSYQQKSLLQGARRGAVSEEEGSSYVPALASGSSFGNLGLTKGWEPEKKLPTQQGRAGQARH
jgi:DNA-directed RNA polymerase subunit beta'